MAAIAKFISFDGGVAFSESVVKIQKRGEEGKLIPIGSVAAVNVRRPQPEADGFIRILTADGQRYKLCFDEEQLRDAVMFKRRLEAQLAGSQDAGAAPQRKQPERRSAEPAPAPKAERAPVPRREQPPVPEEEPEEEEEDVPERGSTATRVLLILIAIVTVAIVVVGVLLFMRQSKSDAPAADPASLGVPATVADLAGDWIQTGSETLDTYHVASIQDETIEIYWHTVSTDTDELYWAGSYQAPATPGDSFSWTSSNDTAKTNNAIMASGDASKVFTYENGLISYEASSMGVTKTVSLEKQ